MAEAITTTILTAVAKGATELVIKSLGTFADKVGGNSKAFMEDKKSNLEAHFRSSFERCIKIKTLLNRATPVDLLTIYVNTKFNVENQKNCDDYTLIERLPDLKRVVITGTGGGGKTMFMKYLWLALFTRESGKIPVFIELRRMNEITSDDLMTYIYKSIIGTSAVISERMFADAARKGDLVFILDGFDEVAKEKKDIIEKQILKFSYDNPEAIIIVSGRPDQRFGSWQNFSVYQVAPMSKQQVLDLVSKFDYDKNTKANFSKRIKSDLYDRHRTFLSNPLLATMMMLTFDQFADIPEKIFVFYEQAFDTLFSKHDATKEGFKRQHKTDLSVDTFKQCLSYMCLFSYHKEIYAFTQSQITEYAEKALKVASVKVKAEDFVADLKEAVCLIQEESLLFVFTHRSFQEYFTALCLANNINDKLPDVLEKIHQRPNDNVVRMLFEMNQFKIERYFLLPKIKWLLDVIDIDKKVDKFLQIVEFFQMEAMIQREVVSPKNRTFRSRLDYIAGNDKFVLFLLLRRLYPRELYLSIEEDEKHFAMDEKAIDAFLKKVNAQRRKPSSIVFSPEGRSYLSPPDELKVYSFAEVRDSGFAQYWSETFDMLRKLQVGITERLEVTQRSIDEILGI